MLVLAALTLALAGVATWSHGPLRGPATPTVDLREWHSRNEQKWIVSQVATAIGDFAAYVREGAASRPAIAATIAVAGHEELVGRFDVFVVPLGLRSRISVLDHIWPPAVYASLAIDALATRIEPDAFAPASHAIERLLDLRTTTVQAVNRDVSAALAAHPTSAAAHPARSCVTPGRRTSP